MFGRGGDSEAAKPEPAARSSMPMPAPDTANLLTGRGGLAAMRAAILFVAVAVAGFLVKVFQEMLSPLVVAVFLLLLIDSVSRSFAHRFPRVPQWLRITLAALLILLGFAAIIALFVFQGPPFANELSGIEPRLNDALAEILTMVGQQPMTVEDIFAGSDPSQGITRAFGAARSALVYAGLVMIYLGFLTASRRAFSAKVDRLYDTDQHRHQARRVFGAIEFAVEQYVKLVTLKALAIAIVAFTLMTFFGVRAALFISFLVFLSAFVPIVGAFAGALIPAMMALAQYGGLKEPLLLLGLLGTAVFVIDNIIMPHLQGDELNIDPLLVLISIGFWGLLLGPPGALLSTPLTVMIMAITAEFEGARWLAILISRNGQPLKDIR